ncbi:ODA11 [Symbiodinium natans]|uniref:ODA11 protein n=1 Tax=Symbiodinium natans TaxID=878477 RepID=A0A812NBU8_9DINO|nr:ODA11 [Symbiodinium natans]
MVDISLQAVDGDSLPKDLYLSLRVGEQQKFSKANCARTYKFSSSPERRYGKIELYRRVGVSTVSLDGEHFQGAHELAIQVEDERMQNKEVRYHFCLGGAGSLPAPTVTNEVAQSDSAKQSSANPKQSSEKVLQAREYLQHHQLEQRLSDAMQAVLRERPEDPAAFIAKKLQTKSGVLKKVEEPKPEQAKPEPVKAVPQPSAEKVPAKPEPPAPPAAPVKSPVSARSAVARDPPAQASCSFPLLPSVATWLAAKPYRILAESPTASPAASPAANPEPFAQLPSVATWLAAKPYPVFEDAPVANPKPPAAPTKAQIPSAAANPVPAAPPTKESSTQPPAAAAKPVPPPAAPTKGSFAKLPSVATWLVAKPAPLFAANPMPIMPPTHPAKSSFAQLPSVGTWLATNLK